MSANARMLAVLFALALAAVALRAVCGPLPGAEGGGRSMYAAAKVGPLPGGLSLQVEMAASDAR